MSTTSLNPHRWSPRAALFCFSMGPPRPSDRCLQAVSWRLLARAPISRHSRRLPVSWRSTIYGASLDASRFLPLRRVRSSARSPGHDRLGDAARSDLNPLWTILDFLPEGRAANWYPKLDYAADSVTPSR